MSALMELKPITNQHAFNTARWEELLADPALARLDQRIETDRYGTILMSPPPGVDHGGWQSDAGFIQRTSALRYRRSISDSVTGTTTSNAYRRNCADGARPLCLNSMRSASTKTKW